MKYCKVLKKYGFRHVHITRVGPGADDGIPGAVFEMWEIPKSDLRIMCQSMRHRGNYSTTWSLYRGGEVLAVSFQTVEEAMAACRLVFPHLVKEKNTHDDKAQKIHKTRRVQPT